MKHFMEEREREKKTGKHCYTGVYHMDFYLAFEMGLAAK
jgi:hypothetical protein